MMDKSLQHPPKSTVVLGRGFLGAEFERQGYTVYGRDTFYHPCHEMHEVLAPFNTVINCIGNADTRACEDVANWDKVHSVNAWLPRMLSDHCSRYHKRFVHISTGCVYDQNDKPQTEDDFTSSHCRYVVSKLTGEYYCRPKDLIIRPRLYFSDQENKNNLLCKLPKFDSHLTEVNSFTSTSTIVEAVTALIYANQSGIFNVAQRGYGTIQQVARSLGLDEKPPMTGEQLQRSQGLALVNNILDISKLEQFYRPRELFHEMERCWQSSTLDPDSLICYS
jgi:dTDP-4-dehydrorhamnose reductase